MKNPILAIIIPCYNEECILNITKERLSSVLDNLIKNEKILAESYLLFVDDGSSDSTWNLITDFNNENSLRYKGLKLSRNFGHQYAILAGLLECNADITITIDADLQDDINAIPEMVEKYHEGSDVVYGIRNDRKTDSVLKRITAELFYKTAEFMGIKTVYNHADYRLVSKKVLEELKKHQEVNLYLRGIIPSLGFKSDKVYYKREKRIGGQPKYNFWKSFSLAIDGITSFSTTPIKFISFAGFLCLFISISILISSVVRNSLSNISIILISMYLLAGIILLSLGIIGEYLGKIYKETKHRQRYIIEKFLK